MKIIKNAKGFYQRDPEIFWYTVLMGGGCIVLFILYILTLIFDWNLF